MILIADMARPIKLFQFAQKLYHSFGIYSTQSDGNHSFNIRNGLILFAWIQMDTFVGTFSLFKAKHLDEFGVGFHIFITTIAVLLYFIIIINQLGNILKLITKFEEFIGKSK